MAGISEHRLRSAAKRVERYMVDTVTIYDGSNIKYNPDTDTWSFGGVVYTGKARIQPIRQQERSNDQVAPQTSQRVRLQLPRSTMKLDIPHAGRVEIVATQDTPHMIGRVGVITNVMDASQSFERTVLCEFPMNKAEM